jgi:hypothetical protein
MRKIGMILCAMGLLAAGPLHAAAVIVVEKLPPDQVAQAIAAASDDTVIEFQGKSETKAQWRNDLEAKIKQQLDTAKLQQIEDQARSKFAADAKALQDQQDAAIAKQNALVEKEFEALGAQ